MSGHNNAAPRDGAVPLPHTHAHTHKRPAHPPTFPPTRETTTKITQIEPQWFRESEFLGRVYFSHTLSTITQTPTPFTIMTLLFLPMNKLQSKPRLCNVHSLSSYPNSLLFSPWLCLFFYFFNFQILQPIFDDTIWKSMLFHPWFSYPNSLLFLPWLCLLLRHQLPNFTTNFWWHDLEVCVISFMITSTSIFACSKK